VIVEMEGVSDMDHTEIPRTSYRLHR